MVWELKDLAQPSDADRLPNGHTLVCTSRWVSEYDAKGKKVWTTKVTMPADANRY